MVELHYHFIFSIAFEFFRESVVLLSVSVVLVVENTLRVLEIVNVSRCHILM